MIRALLLALALAVPAAAQQVPAIGNGETGDVFTLTPELNLEAGDTAGTVEEVVQPRAATGTGARLRGLDKLSGEAVEIELANAETKAFGGLTITLGECRFPAGNPSGDAFAYLVIRAEGQEKPVFEGWMIASSPALNALDHPRYDVWVMRCITA